LAKESDYEHGIYRVMHQASLGGAYCTVISDLIVIEDEPHAVLDWAGPQDKQHPHVTVKLEWSRLSECRNDKTDFLYDGLIEDPRKPS